MKAADRIAKMRESMTPEELERELDDNTEKGAALFIELLDHKAEIAKQLRNDRFISRQIDQAKELYAALIEDGLVQEEEKSEEGSLLDMYTNQQAMDAMKPHLDGVESANPKEAATAMAEVYRMNYEHVCKSFLRPLASKIAKRPIRDNGETISILKEYRSGAFQRLIECLLPQIRNSVDHHDFYYDGRTQKLTFRDRKKTPLVMTLKEFYQMFITSFTLTLAISAAEFEDREPFLRKVASRKELVAQYVKKLNLKLVRDKSGPSIYEIGEALERNRDKW